MPIPNPETPVDINLFNYPITTPEAAKFWDSSHPCNRAKVFIAFSLDEANYRELAKRHGYTREWRDRAWDAFDIYVNLRATEENLISLPFSELETSWWDCMPYSGTAIQTQPQVWAMTPSNCEIPEGSSFTMEVDASGFGDFTYQWYKDDVLIAGATSESYTVNPFELADNGFYHCVVTNSIGSTVSAKLLYATVLVASIITLDPTDQIAETGATATFTTDADQYDSVQWYEQGIAIDGATTTTLMVTADHRSTGNHLKQYAADFTRGTKVTGTANATLTVTVPIPIITLQPLDVRSGVGDTNILRLTADATGYDTLQWFKRNRATGGFEAVAGEIDTEYAEIASYSGFFDRYYAEFSNSYHTVRTNSVAVYIEADEIVVLGSFSLGFSEGFDNGNQ